MVVEANWNRFSFCLATLQCKQRSGTSEANRSFKMRLMIDLEFRSQATPPENFQALPSREVGDSVIYHTLYQSSLLVAHSLLPFRVPFLSRA
jgi:hypothetical protein